MGEKKMLTRIIGSIGIIAVFIGAPLGLRWWTLTSINHPLSSIGSWLFIAALGISIYLCYRLLCAVWKKPAVVTVKTVDPWKGSGCCYIGEARFRRALEGIAEMLSREGRLVLTRFIPEFTCAELYVPGEYAVAHVAVHGSECATYEAVITPIALRECEKNLFSLDSLGINVRFSTAT